MNYRMPVLLAAWISTLAATSSFAASVGKSQATAPDNRAPFKIRIERLSIIHSSLNHAVEQLHSFFRTDSKAQEFDLSSAAYLHDVLLAKANSNVGQLTVFDVPTGVAMAHEHADGNLEMVLVDSMGPLEQTLSPNPHHPGTIHCPDILSFLKNFRRNIAADPFTALRTHYDQALTETLAVALVAQEPAKTAALAHPAAAQK